MIAILDHAVPSVLLSLQNIEAEAEKTHLLGGVSNSESNRLPALHPGALTTWPPPSEKRGSLNADFSDAEMMALVEKRGNVVLGKHP